MGRSSASSLGTFSSEVTALRRLPEMRRIRMTSRKVDENEDLQEIGGETLDVADFGSEWPDPAYVSITDPYSEELTGEDDYVA
jgi:hypothetical protein